VRPENAVHPVDGEPAQSERGHQRQRYPSKLQRAKSAHHFPDHLFPVLGVEDAVMRLNPASTNLVEIRVKRT
jgi:hypothetical protein